jgi:uncharacterized protein YhfF/DNA-binding CsgD family transcriptional regulator
MRSARTEAFWEAFRRHEGLNHAHYQPTLFRTPPEVADRLLTMMSAGTKRATVGPMHYFGEGRDEPMPAAGDYAVLVDRRQRPRLIWRTTSVTAGPLCAVTDEFVWRSGEGTGEREDWLARLGRDFTNMARLHGFEMHADIETMFETVEVVWPNEIASRIRLVAPHIERGVALLHRLARQSSISQRLEAILSRIQTAVLTVGPTLRVGFTNPAAEALLRRSDGLFLKDGYLRTRRLADERSLIAAVSAACARTARVVQSLEPAQRQRGSGVLVAIFRSEMQSPYRTSVFPLRRDHTMRGFASQAEAVLFVDDPYEDASPAQADLYSSAFRLSPAEARLAVLLATGSSLADAADVLSVAYNTARAQLRSIFDKTDTHRQTELVHLLQTSRTLRVSLS